MIVLPIENKLDWRHPPVVTLLLILINTWVYFALVGPDDDALHRAYQLYTANDLIAVEAAPYRAYSKARGADPEDLPEEDALLGEYAVFDLGFDAYLREYPPADAPPEWRQRRDRFEAARREVSWIGYGLVPAQPRVVSMLTSMYLHGGVGHLLGNMVFLFVFGFSLERSIGRVNYFAMYHLTGVCSGLLSVALQGDSYVPGIGASGAVSGLMGAYIAVYRLRRIRFFYNFLVYFGEFRAPALWVFPFWVAKELYGNYFGDQGIGYWAHIGGLLSGAALGLGLSMLTRRVDEEYLDEGIRAQADQDDRRRLHTLVDEFKFDQAKLLCLRLLKTSPMDLNLWGTLLTILRADTSDPDYHRAVMKVIGFAPKAEHDPELLDFVETTYRTYLSGDHPQPALANPQLLQKLGLALARSGHLEAAREVADRLLDNRRATDDVKKFLTALISRLHAIGEIDQAKYYRDLMSQRFGATSSP